MIFISVFFALLFVNHAAQERLSFTSSKGLKITILKSENINFIHAQLIIFYKTEIGNPAIPYVTALNIFSKDLTKSKSTLLNTLRKLGNDYKVEHKADHLVIKINFLSDKIPLFAQFLKALYRYKPFTDPSYITDSYGNREVDTKNRFNDSIGNYWKYFLRQSNWKKIIAYQIAYNKLFPDHSLGNTLIKPDDLKKVNLSKIRLFYKNTYNLTNSLLIIKGNLNPHITYGSIERGLVSIKKQKKIDAKEKKIRVNNRREVLILDMKSNDPPVIFWFDAIPPPSHDDHIPHLIANDILFAYPTGRLFTYKAYVGIRNMSIDTEVVNHKQTSIICNIIRVNFRDIERFILLTDREKKKLSIKRIGRKEYLDALNYYYGKIKVNTEKFDNDVIYEVNKYLFDLRNESYSTRPEIFQQVKLERLDSVGKNSNKSVIVLIGNSRLILSHLNILKPKVIRYIQ